MQQENLIQTNEVDMSSLFSGGNIQSIYLFTELYSYQNVQCTFSSRKFNIYPVVDFNLYTAKTNAFVVFSLNLRRQKLNTSYWASQTKLINLVYLVYFIGPIWWYKRKT